MGMGSKKIRCNVYFDAALWRQFRGACAQHHPGASREFEACMRARLKNWERKKGSQNEKK
jgi:hypothetical protein